MSNLKYVEEMVSVYLQPLEGKCGIAMKAFWVVYGDQLKYWVTTEGQHHHFMTTSEGGNQIIDPTADQFDVEPCYETAKEIIVSDVIRAELMNGLEPFQHKTKDLIGYIASIQNRCD